MTKFEEMLDTENKRVWAQLVAINWIESGRKGVQEAQGGEKSGKRVCYIQPGEKSVKLGYLA